MAPLRKELFLLCVVVVCALWVVPGVKAGKIVNGTCEGANVKCKPGVLMPVWEPQENLGAGDKAARATVYFAALVYLFLGVSIIADRFMAAIEVITSQEKEVTIKRPNGEKQVVHVRIWNETVSNLTLMALGSSTPEILLSVIEIIGNNFVSGELGPGTIVGSAAFNLFVIIGLCVYVVPSNELRQQRHVNVFLITASWSMFAYIWLYLIIDVITPNFIDVWEGIVTLICFPLTVGTAYIADQKLFGKVIPKKYRSSRSKTVVISGEGTATELNMVEGKLDHIPDELVNSMSAKECEELQEFEDTRQEYITVLRELRKKNPDADMDSLQHMANYEIMNRGPKSRAFYRIQATRKLTGGGNVISKKKVEAIDQGYLSEVKADDDDAYITKVFFEPAHYTVFENVGTCHITIVREGGDSNTTVYVDYKTEDGTANAVSDYEYTEGTLVFKPGETKKTVPVTIVDDEVFEEDEHFYLHLSNVRIGGPDGMFMINGPALPPTAKLATPFVATVMILDDDHHGVFTFEQPEYEVVESIGEAQFRVCRHSGARGKVALRFRAENGTAKKGQDFEVEASELVFDNDQTE